MNEYGCMNYITNNGYEFDYIKWKGNISALFFLTEMSAFGASEDHVMFLCLVQYLKFDHLKSKVLTKVKSP